VKRDTVVVLLEILYSGEPAREHRRRSKCTRVEVVEDGQAVKSRVPGQDPTCQEERSKTRDVGHWFQNWSPVEAFFTWLAARGRRQRDRVGHRKWDPVLGNCSFMEEGNNIPPKLFGRETDGTVVVELVPKVSQANCLVGAVSSLGRASDNTNPVLDEDVKLLCNSPV
jgi:hypothetical protein